MSRKVIIMSGVSGSGKSTYVRENFVGAALVSADHYFFDSRGQYQFDPSKLGAAHASCFRQFIGALERGYEERIVVDNTNCSVEEIAPYVLGAEAFQYEPEIITLYVAGYNLEKCAERNSHQVSLSAIRNQYGKLYNSKFPPWWKNTDILMKFPS